MKNIRLSSLAICCLLVCACARQPIPLTPEQANNTWQHYLASTSRTIPTAGRSQLSLRLGKDGDSRRVTALLWGNSNGALRLDIMAGVGVSIAKIAETDTTFILYAPHDQKAYEHNGLPKPLFKVGLPIPLQISAIFALLQGDYATLFGKTHVGATVNAQNETVFSVQDGLLTGTLTLTQSGLPYQWKQDANQGWQMTITYTEDMPQLPRRIDLVHADGHQAILLVKNREMLPIPFTDKQLSLPLPKGTTIEPLSQYQNKTK